MIDIVNRKIDYQNYTVVELDYACQYIAPVSILVI